MVSVVDWTDIIVDLSWDSGKETEGGAEPKAFTMEVSTGGSTTWSARSIVIEMTVSGTLSEAQSGGVDIMGTNDVTDIGVGGDTEVFRHQNDETNFTNDTRYVIDFEDSAEWYGSVTPDSSGGSGDYSISVVVKSYVVYGQLPDCEETVAANTTGNNTDPNATAEDITYLHFCEVTFYADADASTSEDMLEGTIQTFHDIGVSTLVINQGYVVDENDQPINSPTMPGMVEGPLNPAWSSIQASVRHLGSDLSVTYDWEVTFDIENTVTGVTTTLTADSCTFGQGFEYVHAELGDDMGRRCFPSWRGVRDANFAPGIYTITATISMVNGTAGQEDMSARNDDMSIYDISALNNRPSVSLTVQEEEYSIVMSPDSTITLEADAFDADDDTGESCPTFGHPGMMQSTVLCSHPHVMDLAWHSQHVY